MRIIATTSELAALCSEFASESFVTVDTEFMRERTYWPQLCLIQIAADEIEAIVDPLANGIDLKPFFDLMANPSVLKVFHAARQDVEIVHYLAGIIPQPLFDTQVAAMVCGFGDQIGYEAIVRKLAGAQVDKSSRFTDWSRRPLSEKQLAYALSDVTHLRTIYRKLKKKLDASGREPWLKEEMAILTSASTYAAHPEDAWQRIKFRPRRKQQIGVLQAVAAWREIEAQRKNVPRNRVVKDDVITELAIQQPRSREDLNKLRALPRGYAGSQIGDDLLGAVKRGLQADLSSLPDISGNGPGKPEGASAIADVLKLALKIISEREGIAPKLIASSADIDKIAAGEFDGVRAMRGWRREVFGEVALNIRDGKLALGLKDGNTAIFPIPGSTVALKAAE
jgi:ribonuclease D